MKKRYLFILLIAIVALLGYIGSLFEVDTLGHKFFGITAWGIVLYLMVMLVEAFLGIGQKRKG